MIEPQEAAANLSERLNRFIDNAVAFIREPQIALDGDRLATSFANRRHRLLGTGSTVRVVHRHPRTPLRQPDGYPLTDRDSGAGHQRALSIQIAHIALRAN